MDTEKNINICNMDKKYHRPKNNILKLVLPVLGLWLLFFCKCMYGQNESIIEYNAPAVVKSETTVRFRCTPENSTITSVVISDRKNINTMSDFDIDDDVRTITHTFINTTGMYLPVKINMNIKIENYPLEYTEIIVVSPKRTDIPVTDPDHPVSLSPSGGVVTYQVTKTDTYDECLYIISQNVIDILEMKLNRAGEKYNLEIKYGDNKTGHELNDRLDIYEIRNNGDNLVQAIHLLQPAVPGEGKYNMFDLPYAGEIADNEILKNEMHVIEVTLKGEIDGEIRDISDLIGIVVEDGIQDGLEYDILVIGDKSELEMDVIEITEPKTIIENIPGQGNISHIYVVVRSEQKEQNSYTIRHAKRHYLPYIRELKLFQTDDDGTEKDPFYHVEIIKEIIDGKINFRKVFRESKESQNYCEIANPARDVRGEITFSAEMKNDDDDNIEVILNKVYLETSNITTSDNKVFQFLISTDKISGQDRYDLKINGKNTEGKNLMTEYINPDPYSGEYFYPFILEEFDNWNKGIQKSPGGGDNEFPFYVGNPNFAYSEDCGTYIDFTWKAYDRVVDFEGFVSNNVKFSTDNIKYRWDFGDNRDALGTNVKSLTYVYDNSDNIDKTQFDVTFTVILENGVTFSTHKPVNVTGNDPDLYSVGFSLENVDNKTSTYTFSADWKGTEPNTFTWKVNSIMQPSNSGTLQVKLNPAKKKHKIELTASWKSGLKLTKTHYITLCGFDYQN